MGCGGVEVWEGVQGHVGLAGPGKASDFYTQVKKPLKEFVFTSLLQRCFLAAFSGRQEGGNCVKSEPGGLVQVRGSGA